MALATAPAMHARAQSIAEPAKEAAGAGEHASPQEHRVQDLFTWSAPPECIAVIELRDRIERTVRRPRLSGTRRVLGRMFRGDGSYRVVFRIEEDGEIVGRRVLDLPEPDCRDTDESLELVAAMLLEGGLRQEEREAYAQEQRELEQEREAQLEAQRPPAGEVRWDGSVLGSWPQQWRAGLGLEATVGLAPRVAFAPRIELWSQPRLPLWFGIRASFSPEQASAPPQALGKLALQTTRLGATACLRTWDSGTQDPSGVRLGLDSCVGAGLIIQQGRGRGFARDESALWISPEMNFSSRLSGRLLDPARWVVTPSLLLPMSKAEYFAAESGASDDSAETTLFGTSRVLGALTVGVEATF